MIICAIHLHVQTANFGSFHNKLKLGFSCEVGDRLESGSDERFMVKGVAEIWRSLIAFSNGDKQVSRVIHIGQHVQALTFFHGKWELHVHGQNYQLFMVYNHRNFGLF